MRDLRSYTELALAMIIVGSSIVVGKLIISSFPIFLALGLRFVIGSIILVPLLLKMEKGMPKLGRRDWVILFLQALCGIFLFHVLLLYGLKYTSAVEGSIVTSTTPAIVGIIAFMFLREKLTWQRAAGIALAVAGILSVNVFGSSGEAERGVDPLLGNLLILAAAFVEALWTIFRKVLSDKATPFVSAAVVNVFGLLMFLPFAVFEAADFDFASVSFTDWLPIFYYGIVVTIGAYILWFRGMMKVDASTAGVFTGIMPVSAVLLSYGILGEAFHWSHLAGVACVLLGILCISRSPGGKR